jgi:hypothetical protein
MLQEADIKRFQKLYRLRFGVVLDNNTAQRKLALLVTQMQAIYKPITKSRANEYVNEEQGNEQVGKSA